jgi:lipopolysaccharide transport system permease protein
MFVTPVIYPITQIPEKYRIFILANPVSPLLEAFKYGFTGSGFFSPFYILYSTVFTVLLFFFSLMVFNRVEKSFMDIV